MNEYIGEYRDLMDNPHDDADEYIWDDVIMHLLYNMYNIDQYAHLCIYVEEITCILMMTTCSIMQNDVYIDRCSDMW